MSIGTPERSRESLSRSAARNKSYVDLTAGSESENEVMEDVKPARSSQQGASSSKRKRVSQTGRLQKTKVVLTRQAASTPRASSQDAETELEEDEYEIDHIVDARVRWGKAKGSVHFRVRWKGYDETEDSWTPADQFHEDDPPVLDFYKRNPTKPSMSKYASPSSKKTASSTTRSSAKSPAKVESKLETDRPASTNGVTRTLSGRGGDLKSFFGGKENRDPSTQSKVASTSKVGKAVKVEKVEKVKKEKAAPPKKKRKTDDDDDSDFIVDGAMDDVEDDDDGGSFAAEF